MKFPGPRLTRRSAISLLAAPLVVGSLPGIAQVEAAPNYADWFGYGEDAMLEWNFVETPETPWIVTIRRKTPLSASPQRVMVIYPRPSSAYDVAITKVLNVFAEKDIDVEFTVYNFAKTDSRGFQALGMAESGDFDLVYSMGSESTAWLWDHYRDGALPVISDPRPCG